MAKISNSKTNTLVAGTSDADSISNGRMNVTKGAQGMIPFLPLD